MDSWIQIIVGVASLIIGIAGLSQFQELPYWYLSGWLCFASMGIGSLYIVTKERRESSAEIAKLEEEIIDERKRSGRAYKKIRELKDELSHAIQDAKNAHDERRKNTDLTQFVLSKLEVTEAKPKQRPKDDEI